jgi:hypothetical protein
MANLIAGKSRGPRRRRYNLAPAFRPSVDEHLQRLQLQGSQGGLLANQCDITSDFQACQDSDPPSPWTPDIGFAVDELTAQLRK